MQIFCTTFEYITLREMFIEVLKSDLEKLYVNI